MKYNKIILLSDMDGTLLDSNSKVSVKNQEAILDFTSKGGKFGIATGRSHLNFESFLDHVHVNSPCILYNGCGLYDFVNKKFLVLHNLPNKQLIDYLKYCLKEFQDVIIQIHSLERSTIVSSEILADTAFVAGHQPCGFGDLADVIEIPWIKVLLCGDKKDLLKMERKMVDFGLNEVIGSVYSSERYLELLPGQNTKGSMLAELREIVGSDHKIYAVGDYNNDLEMLKLADVGIATQNALPSVKEIADVITVSNDESAIAHIIYHLMEVKFT